MKHRLAWKLLLYFSISLIAFSLIIGLVFMTLFKDHTVRLYQADLEKRTAVIAEGLSDYLTDAENLSADNSNSPNIRKGGNGNLMARYGRFLRLIDNLAMSDVWIVDPHFSILRIGKSDTQAYESPDFSDEAVEVLKQVFNGQSAVSRSFSAQLNAPTLTVGAPVIVNDQVVSALLLHEPVKGMDEAVNEGLRMLFISSMAALVLSILLALGLTFLFTRPLEKMRQAALRLAEGDYAVSTEVSQKDEIGALASAIDHLSQRLSAVSKEREMLDQLRQDFVVNISHELRTPVTVLRSSLEALTDKVVTKPDEIAEYHRQMLQESRSLERLVNDLLELSKLQNADFAIQKEALNIGDALTDALRSVTPLAAAKDVTFERDMAGSNLHFEGDYGRLRQMFLIILDNAIKFSPVGGRIFVSLDAEKITIADQGPGIEAADLPYIFDRFYKVRSQNNKTGSGLGLAIAKEIARRHGIEIKAESQDGQGTRFMFYLPIKD
ncbi:MAG TPA: cell wall metabolism sensor histidine kinase WalK [Clostridiales bacterium]|jgi:signal transduction histidine kinase|nr:cell wall metabolism sensor histidine kinase WalK [Clostridiales bacterium]